MTFIARRGAYEIWAQFDQTAQVYELFFDQEGETYTGWNTDSLKDARAAAKYIFAEVMAF
jgi:hypothetical protein